MTEYVSYIVNTIKQGLSGDYKKDMEYLHEMSEKYKMDEDASEILQEIAKMMFELLPDEEKENLGNKLEEMATKRQEQFDTVKRLVQANDFENAEDLMKAILESCEGMFEEDENTIFLSLNHVLEFYIYSYYFKPVKEVQAADIRYNEYFRTYGVILAHLERYEEAEKAQKEAIKWNPVDLDSILALAEVYKHQEKLEEYLKVTKQAYRFCCTRATMARYYRNLGFYYTEKYKPDIARALYVYSNIYFQTDNADSELKYLEEALQNKTPDYDVQTLQKILNENEIQPGPDSDTIGIVYRVGQILMNEGNQKAAADCFSIVYDITQDEECEQILKKLGVFEA